MTEPTLPDLSRYNLEVIEPHDGGVMVYRPHSDVSRHFDTLEELRAWVRTDFPEWCRDEARDILHAIGEIAWLLDPEGPKNCDNPVAVVSAIRRLCNDGLQLLEYVEIAQADARREASK